MLDLVLVVSILDVELSKQIQNTPLKTNFMYDRPIFKFPSSLLFTLIESTLIISLFYDFLF